ncbi:hypothetical protein V2P24_01070 [Mycoplasma putrefaciens]|uniref:Mbov_0396 family ICE element transmembrane protein n=1 Tax=Mycoplasma putrefaciens TaxID=2123 RepID=UPI003DA210AA
MWNWITWGIFILGYVPLVRLPLVFLEGVSSIFQLLAIGLPQYLLFGIPIDGKFSDATLPYLFIRLSIISILVFVILFVISLIRVHFQKENEENPIKIAMKNSLTGTVWLISIPLILFIATTIFNILLTLISGDASDSISKTIFASLRNHRNNDISVSEWEKIANNGFNFERSTFNKLANQEGLILVLMGGLISISTLIPFLLGILTLVQKIFQQFFLFIISPFIASASVSDNGKRMKQFQEMYAAKSFAIIGIIISLQLFGVFVSRAQEWVFGLNNISIIVRFLLLFAIITGGAVASMGITNEITAFVGESASVRETLGETKNLISSTVALSGGAGAIGAFAKKAINSTTKKGRLRNKRNEEIKLAKQKLKKGHITRSDYQNATVGAQYSYKQGLNDIKTEKLALKAAKQNFLDNEEIINSNELESSERLSAFKQNEGLSKKDFSRNESSLIRQQNKAYKEVKKINKLEKGTGQLSDESEWLRSKNLTRIKKLQGLIDQKNSGKITKATNKSKIQFDKEIQDQLGLKKK